MAVGHTIVNRELQVNFREATGFHATNSGMQSMKARLLLARNLHAILTARGQNQTDLAQWCHKKSSWINKILAGTRPLHIDDFDRVADFCGLNVYQLFSPGVSHLTERRRLVDRRGAKERRIGHVNRIIEEKRPAATGDPHVPAAATISNDLRRDLSALAQHVTAVLRQADAGGQAPPARAHVTKMRRRRRVSRRPTDQKD